MLRNTKGQKPSIIFFYDHLNYSTSDEDLPHLSIDVLDHVA